MRQSYDADEAERILERAATRTAGGGSAVSRERLLAMAEELGISPEEVEAAAAEVEAERQARELRAEFVAKRRSEFRDHFASFLWVGLLLAGIDAFKDHRLGWSLYVLLPWLLFVAAHAAEALPAGGARFEKEFADWRAKRVKQEQQRARRRERRAAKRGEKAAAEEIAAVEERAGLTEEDDEVLRPAMPARNPAEEANAEVVRVGRSAGE
jgi:hypothetical protein